MIEVFVGFEFKQPLVAVFFERLFEGGLFRCCGSCAFAFRTVFSKRLFGVSLHGHSHDELRDARGAGLGDVFGRDCGDGESAVKEELFVGVVFAGVFHEPAEFGFADFLGDLFGGLAQGVDALGREFVGVPKDAGQQQRPRGGGAGGSGVFMHRMPAPARDREKEQGGGDRNRGGPADRTDLYRVCAPAFSRKTSRMGVYSDPDCRRREGRRLSCYRSFS